MYRIVTDGHWTWIVQAKYREEAKNILLAKRPDAGSNLKVENLDKVMKKYDGVIGLEGVEPPFVEGR